MIPLLSPSCQPSSIGGWKFVIKFTTWLWIHHLATLTPVLWYQYVTSFEQTIFCTEPNSTHQMLGAILLLNPWYINISVEKFATCHSTKSARIWPHFTTHRQGGFPMIKKIPLGYIGKKSITSSTTPKVRPSHHHLFLGANYSWWCQPVWKIYS